MSLVSTISGLFKWRQFEPEVILLAVGWYLRFSLSYRDVEELLQERGIVVDHVTLWRGVQRYAPERDRGKSEAEEPARSHAFGCSWVGMHREEKNWQSPAATLGRHIDCARSCLRFAPASQTEPLAVR
jgi:hypothetical protein